MLFHHFSVDLDKLHIYEVVLIYSIQNYQKRIQNIFSTTYIEKASNSKNPEFYLLQPKSFGMFLEGLNLLFE